MAHVTARQHCTHSILKSSYTQVSPALIKQVRQCSTTAAAAVPRPKSWLQEAKGWTKIFKQLSKAKLSGLVVATAAVGFVAGTLPALCMKQRLLQMFEGTPT